MEDIKQYIKSLTGITEDINKDLARKHLQRYEGLIRKGEGGSQNVNLSECRNYHRIWRGILAKKFDLDQLTDEEISEYFDAIEDEGFGLGGGEE